MSHNVSMSGIEIKDFKILAQAVDDINKRFGTNFRLEVGAVASRNYAAFGSGGGKQVLPGTQAVIHCPTLHYDIAIRKGADGKQSMETEALSITELRNLLRVPSSPRDLLKKEAVSVGHTGYRRDEALGMRAVLGVFQQHYSCRVAERQAAMSGKRATRQYDEQTGVLSLVVTQ
jgi:hypothetical protein